MTAVVGKNYVVFSHAFRLNKTPDLKKGDRVRTDFFRQGDRRIFFVVGFRRGTQTSSKTQVHLAAHTCRSCGHLQESVGWIDGSWAIPVGAKVHKEK